MKTNTQDLSGASAGHLTSTGGEGGTSLPAGRKEVQSFSSRPGAASPEQEPRAQDSEVLWSPGQQDGLAGPRDLGP